MLGNDDASALINNNLDCYFAIRQRVGVRVETRTASIFMILIVVALGAIGFALAKSLH